MKLRSTQLDALLRNWDMYEKMLSEYKAGTGSMAVEAEKTANSWEGSLNRLSNTWASVVNNIADSDAVTTSINGLNDILGIINKITNTLGSVGTIAATTFTVLAVGLKMNKFEKLAGRAKMIALKSMPAISCR